MTYTLNTVIELKDVISPITMIDSLINSGIKITTRHDVIFINEEIDNTNGYAETLAQFLSQELCNEHEPVIINMIADNPLDNYELVVANNIAYIKQLEELQLC